MESISRYNNLKFTQSQKIGIFIDDIKELTHSHLLSYMPFNNSSFDFYYVSNNEMQFIEEDCVSNNFLLDVIIFHDGFNDLELLSLIIQTCKIFGVPIIFIVDDFNRFKNFDENYKNCITMICQNSDLIISSEFENNEPIINDVEVKFINPLQENLHEILLNILILNKRDKNSILFDYFKSFISLKRKEEGLLFKEFIVKKSHDIIKSSLLFDEQWYLDEYPDVKCLDISPIKHYLTLGVLEGCNPSNSFNTNEYLENNDIGINPLVHHILYHDVGLFIDLNSYERRELHRLQSFNSRQIIKNELNSVELWGDDYIIDFKEFLSRSYISPYISAPFKFEHKRCFSFMDHISKYLRNNLKKTNFNPLVSVILPVYNCVSVIQNAIDSVLEQSYENIELIIIDDGSSDGTMEFLEDLDNEKIKCLRNEVNRGVSNARNQGIIHSNGEYIAYLDADNLWDSKYIESMIGAFLELPDADAVYSGQLIYDKYDKNPMGMRFATFNKSLLENNSFIDLNSFCHKKDIFEKIGGFNEELSCLEDWEFILKISNDFKIYSIPILLSKYYLNNIPNRISDDVNIIKNYDFLFEFKSQKTSSIIELNKKVSVIIPSYESLEDLEECLNSIFSIYSSDLVEVIIVDNNSHLDVKNYLKNLELNGKIKLILNDINYGFSYAVNQGINISDENSDLLILNNDAILTKNSIEYLQKYSYELDDSGIVVPQQILIPSDNHNVKFHVPYANNDMECDINPSLAHRNIINVPLFHDGEILELNFAPFFCVYIKRDILDNSLWLDAELGRHYRSDRIFSNFVRYILNKKIYHISKSCVFHKLQKATQNLKEDNKDNFKYMYYKNQWEPDLANKLGYKRALWDYD